MLSIWSIRPPCMKASTHRISLAPKTSSTLQNCNGYPPTCFGANDVLVGHEAAQALGNHAGGQCQTNPLVGEWWSLPERGRCVGDDTPEKGSCSWKATKKKTIDSTCLFDLLKFKEACKADGRAPFSSATNIFLSAFAKNDPAEGGCPPIS